MRVSLGRSSSARLRLGLSRKCAPSGSENLSVELPSLRLAGEAYTPARTLGIAIESAWSIRPRLRSSREIRPPTSEREDADTPHHGSAPCHESGPNTRDPEDTLCLAQPHDARHPVA